MRFPSLVTPSFEQVHSCLTEELHKVEVWYYLRYCLLSVAPFKPSFHQRNVIIRIGTTYPIHLKTHTLPYTCKKEANKKGGNYELYQIVWCRNGDKTCTAIQLPVLETKFILIVPYAWTLQRYTHMSTKMEAFDISNVKYIFLTQLRRTNWWW